MVKRTLGPLLIVALGVAFLFGLGSAPPAGAGGVTPCTTLEVGNVVPCETTTTARVTTTTEPPATTAPATTASSAPAKTTTTAKAAVAAANAAKKTPNAERPAGQLARTGSNNGPLTGLGIGLVLLGFGLLVTSTRVHRRRAQA